MKITTELAHRLVRYFECSCIDIPSTIQVIYHFSYGIEKDNSPLFKNSYILASFEHSREEQKEMSELLPSGMPPYTNGYLLLYTPHGKPSHDDVEKFRIIMKAFVAGPDPTKQMCKRHNNSFSCGCIF